MKSTLLICLAALLFFSCRKEEQSTIYAPLELMEIPSHFPDLNIPPDNSFSQSRWDLGKKLFYDPIMSSDQSISCASCHKAENAFADNMSTSPGVAHRPGTRNVPSLSNVAFHPYYTREGAVPTLEMQILVPIQEHNEFDFNIVLIAERLQQDSSYVQMSRTAYDREPDAFVITRSLAMFERSLISGNSAYDKFIQGELELDASARQGKLLFESDRLNCTACHNGFDFTDYSIRNNGLYKAYTDTGKFRLTGDSSDLATFKVPSLRNVALTAPYMHDGSLASLDAVIDHYMTGGHAHPNRSQELKPFALNSEEKRDLINFLHKLTDQSFIENEIFQ